MMPLLVHLTWLLPVAAALASMCVPRERRDLLRWGNLAATGAVLGLVVVLLGAYLVQGPDPGYTDGTSPRLAFVTRIAWFPALGMELFTGVDAISLLMMLMAAVIAVCGVLVSWWIEDRATEFFVLLQILLAGTFGCFVSVDLLAFFLFNEITLIPTYLLIGMFGSGRRDAAAMKLNLMLFGGSALILVGLCGLKAVGGSFALTDLAGDPGLAAAAGFQFWAFPCLFLGFAILGSLFPFHTWSPDGHAAAPTAVSMFLAGVHMKLGGYGCLRVALYLLPSGAHEWLWVFMLLAAISVVYGALIALRHTDLKFINAYSSVSHVGLVTFAFATMGATGLRGGVLQMLAHGFVTALVFALIGMIAARTGTRDITAMGGLMRRARFLAVCFVLAGFAVVAAPGSASFVAELTIFVAGFASADGALPFVCAALCVSAVVLTAIYVLRAVNAVVHGDADPGELTPPAWWERVPVLLLLACILGMGLAPGWLIAALDESLAPIVQRLEQP